MLLSLPNGYLQPDGIASLFDSKLFQFIAPDVLEWIHSTFPEAPVGPFLATFEPLPMVRGAENVEASVMIIRGSQAEITSEADSLDFLSKISGRMRVMDVLKGAGPVPHLEGNHYQRVLEDIAWFLSG